MHIIWQGQFCFQIVTALRKEKEPISIVVDPVDRGTGLKPSVLKPDILLVTHDYFDGDNKRWDKIKGEPFLITIPGEYELKDVFLQGILADGKRKGENIIFVIEAEGIRVCHLGGLNQSELTPDQLDAMGVVDILFVPVGGVNTIDGSQALKIVNQIEPKIVIPMYFQIPHFTLSQKSGGRTKLDGLDKFLKAIGRKSIESQPKLLIKKKDLPQETKIIVLEP